MELPLGLPDKDNIPLGSLVKIKRRDEVTNIAHRYGERYAALVINLAGMVKLQYEIFIGAYGG